MDSRLANGPIQTQLSRHAEPPNFRDPGCRTGWAGNIGLADEAAGGFAVGFGGFGEGGVPV